MPKQKLFIIIAGITLAVILFLVFIISMILRNRNTSSIGSVTPTLHPEEALEQQNLYIKEVVEHYDEEFPRTASIRDAELFLLENGIPSSYQKVNSNYPANTSIDGTYTAEIADALITISRTTNRSIVTSLTLEKDTDETLISWVTDTTLLLIEKQKADLKIDRIYLIDINTPEKIFVAGSFPVASRFNLSIPIEVYNRGEQIVFTDNDAQRWLLTLEYR